MVYAVVGIDIDYEVLGPNGGMLIIGFAIKPDSVTGQAL